MKKNKYIKSCNIAGHNFAYKLGYWIEIDNGGHELGEKYEELTDVSRTQMCYSAKIYGKKQYRLFSTCSYGLHVFGPYNSIHYYDINRIFAQDTESKWHLLSAYGEMLDTFDSLIEIAPNIFTFEIEERGWGVINSEGKILVPPIFKDSFRWDFKNTGNITIERILSYNNRKGIFEFQNYSLVRSISPAIYHEIYHPYKEDRWDVSEIVKYGNGVLIGKRVYSNFFFAVKSRDSGGENELWGDYTSFFDRSKVIECYLMNGIKLCSTYKYYVLTNDGKYVFAGKDGYATIKQEDYGCELYDFDGVYDFINDKGDIIISEIYNFIYDSNDLLLLKVDPEANLWLIINKSKFISPTKKIVNRKVTFPFKIDYNFIVNQTDYLWDFNKQRIIEEFRKAKFGIDDATVSYYLREYLTQKERKETYYDDSCYEKYDDFHNGAYDNPYYNETLDFDQQSQDFWENM